MNEIHHIHPSPKRTYDKGFTLIELIIVLLIAGLLSAIAIPSFIGQVGKAREVDAKNNLGTIARSQQAYHFEKKNFANNINQLGISGLSNSNYYNYPNPTIANNIIAKHQAIALNPSTDRVKNYAIGIYHTSGLFDTVICQAIDVNQPVEVGNTVSDNCTNNGIKLN